MRTIVMTGGTSGIGRVAAGELLRRDPRLHLVLLARGERGRAALAELRPVSDDVSLVEADLASMRSVRSAVRQVRRELDAGELPPLAGIAGNAGVSLGDAQHATPDGYETTFAVNVLANHLLIGGLAPSLRAPARIVITVSDTHFGDVRHGWGMPAPRWSEPAVLAQPGVLPRADTATAGRTAYTTSKLAAIYLVHEWARRLPTGVDVVSYNPGLVPGTGLARDGGLAARVVMRWVAPVLNATPLVDTVPVAGGKLADAILGRVAAPSGGYIDRGRAARSSEESYDTARERELWEHAEGVRAAVEA